MTILTEKPLKKLAPLYKFAILKRNSILSVIFSALKNCILGSYQSLLACRPYFLVFTIDARDRVLCILTSMSSQPAGAGPDNKQYFIFKPIVKVN